jgi:ATP-dependent Clp protease ATP-binding subunit ClpB
MEGGQPMKKRARVQPGHRPAAASAANSRRTRKLAQARKKRPHKSAPKREAPARSAKSSQRKTGVRGGAAGTRPASARAAVNRGASGGPKPAARRKRAKPKAARRRLVRDENTVLLHLEDLLQQRIVGKDEAIRRVANVIRIRRTNLDFKPHRPDGSFLIVGPPGVGKTEFANAVAEVLLGTDSMVINLDMADYTEEEDVEDLLVTAYPGTEGVLVEGSLTTPVRRNPRSVILFRGIERAHEAVRRLLLHILERGTIVDAQGEVSFSQTIIFATTRMETEDVELVEQIGFTRSTIPRDERQRKILEEQFSQELVGAFNAVLFFSGLTTEDVRLIARYKVNAVLERLKEQNRGVIISDRVYDTFIKEGEVKKAGARYLNRALEEKLFTPLSKYLLEHAAARSIVVDVQDDGLIIRSSAK